MMRKTVATLFFLTFVIVSGCSDENTKIKGQFVEGCVQSGVSKSICTCTFGKLENKYSLAGLQVMNTPGKALPEGFVKDLATAARTCQAED